MSDREKDLQAQELADLARRLEAALEVDAPDARREKSLFVAGVAAGRRSRGRLGPLVPALAAVVLLVAIGIVSRTAQPGQALFPVRKVLGNVGLAPSVTKEIRELLVRADQVVVQAESSATSAPTRVEALVGEVWAILDRADDLAGELDSDRRRAFEAEIDSLEDRAEAAEDRADDTIDAREEAAEEAEDDGRRGSDDDSSGKGSGGDDSSGNGSGGDDSIGPGSGDEDSSGSRSGGGDDSSGSGSGSGGDDSSGSGSGGDDDSSGKG